jgi:5-oxoprolinase (ATP-hydrolysing)
MNVFQANYADLAYGETICGGHGAGPTWSGESGVHINMTNTKVWPTKAHRSESPQLNFRNR